MLTGWRRFAPALFPCSSVPRYLASPHASATWTMPCTSTLARSPASMSRPSRRRRRPLSAAQFRRFRRSCRSREPACRPDRASRPCRRRPARRRASLHASARAARPRRSSPLPLVATGVSDGELTCVRMNCSSAAALEAPGHGDRRSLHGPAGSTVSAARLSVSRSTSAASSRLHAAADIATARPHPAMNAFDNSLELISPST